MPELGIRHLLLTMVVGGVGCSATTNGAAGGGGALTGTLYCELGESGDLHQLDLATGAYKKLGFGHGAVLTPEGTLVYDDGNDLVESPVDLTTKRVIVKINADVEHSNNGEHDPQLSPDGSKIAYQTNDNNAYVVDRQSGKVLARFEQKSVSDAFLDPSWTPDGRLVLGGGFANPGLYVSDAGLTTLTRFDPDLTQPTYPRVSPDGTKVAFVLQERLYVVGLDGTGLTRLDPQEDGEDRFPTWSPDGTKVGFYHNGRLQFVAAAGGTPTDLWDLYPDLSDRFLVVSTSYQFDWK